jgi:DNA adenine methylase
MTDLMPIKALVPAFGGKRNLAPPIVELLGPHRVYWEPFCLSMAVLLAKPPCTMETVNDLHGDLVNLARVIQDARLGPKLYRRLRRTLMCEQFFREADAVVRAAETTELTGPGEIDLDLAYRYFLVSWLGRNGTAGTPATHKGTYCLRFTNSGGHGAKRWNSVIRSIPAWRKRLANVTILRRDAFDLLPRIEDAAGTVIYCDPPYIVKGARYLHDFTAEDHQRLASALARFRRARVVVSYYDHPRLAELYPGWHQTRIDVSKAMAHCGKRGTNECRATEILLCNQTPESLGLF